MSEIQKEVQILLEGTGVTLNGPNPWDPQIHDSRFYGRVLKKGSLGMGESYMDGWWDCESIDELISRLMRIDIRKKLGKNWLVLVGLLLSTLTNRQNKRRAFKIGEAHYDVGNDLYKAMLDKRMVYTCGYWKDAHNLDEAQEAKLEIVCRKIGLKQGDKVLDIGCGWGSFAKFAAEKYSARVVGITVSKEQLELGKKNCEGLSVELRYQDYRDVNEKFDHIVSLGMIEHVGYKNFKNYFKVAARCLKDDGLFLLHTIGGNKSVKRTDPWIEKYIFPNSMLPSLSQLFKAIEGDFIVEDLHNFGTDYDKTLIAWNRNFEDRWLELSDKYNESFHRMWRYYLLSCAGTFRCRQNQLWQIVLSKNGVIGGYKSIR